MKAVIQRVKGAGVDIDGEMISECGKGLCILLGVSEGDDEAVAVAMAEKISKMRIFEDENGKMNRSVIDVEGDALVVSNFTLCADCSHGNRPDFFGAARPESAVPLYEKFIEVLSKQLGKTVYTGRFGADMKLSLVNDGPVTIVLDSASLKLRKNDVKGESI